MYANKVDMYVSLNPFMWLYGISFGYKLIRNAEAAVQPAFRRAIQKKRLREHGEGFSIAVHWSKSGGVERKNCEFMWVYLNLCEFMQICIKFVWIYVNLCDFSMYVI